MILQKLQIETQTCVQNSAACCQQSTLNTLQHVTLWLNHIPSTCEILQFPLPGMFFSHIPTLGTLPIY